MNCLWEQKTKFDNCILQNKVFDTNYRYKCGIISKTVEELESEMSITFVNGPFGDFVNFPDDYMYFSWYPYSMKGLSCSDTPPNNWIIDNLIDNQEIFLSNHNEIFESIFNKRFTFIDPNIIGGIIVGKGNKDIHDKDSPLHTRNDERVVYDNDYYTISTGKFTSAPYNAVLLVFP